MQEKSWADGSSGRLRRAGWTLTAGGTGDKRWGSLGKGVDFDHPLVNVDGVRELEGAARQGFAGAMITEYQPEDRRDDQPGYEILSAAQDLDMPLSLHTATRRQGKIRGVGPKTLRDASSRATRAFGPANLRHDFSWVCAMLDARDCGIIGMASPEGSHRCPYENPPTVEEGTRPVRTLWHGDWLGSSSPVSFTENGTDPIALTPGVSVNRLHGFERLNMQSSGGLSRCRLNEGTLVPCGASKGRRRSR